MADGKTFGTADPDAPITRADFERALRYMNLTDVTMRDALLRLAAQVVALTDELVRRIDGVEPTPAEPNTPARPKTGTLEEDVASSIDENLAKIRATDLENNTYRVWLETDALDKYETPGPDIPCAELLHLCQARCCRMTFALSTLDLDEGVIRWDYGQPYMIRQRASDGFCVHNDPATKGCTVHAQRPLVCRKYDCRDDARVWIDYEQRIPAPLDAAVEVAKKEFDLMDRVQRRLLSVVGESNAINHVYPDDDPTTGPPPAPGRRMYRRR
jgi:Fe-S-cluster containining protein